MSRHLRSPFARFALAIIVLLVATTGSRPPDSSMIS